MPTISKDLVNHLNITEADAGQRLDNYSHQDFERGA
jgi:hypothetical protein